MKNGISVDLLLIPFFFHKNTQLVTKSFVC